VVDEFDRPKQRGLKQHAEGEKCRSLGLVLGRGSLKIDNVRERNSDGRPLHGPALVRLERLVSLPIGMTISSVSVGLVGIF
jgi:hypothetical protein